MTDTVVNAWHVKLGPVGKLRLTNEDYQQGNKYSDRKKGAAYNPKLQREDHQRELRGIYVCRNGNREEQAAN